MTVKERLTDLGHYAAYLLIRVFICLLQAVSIETCHRMAKGLAWVATRVIPFRRELLER